jgi:hypothetical protein
VIEGGVFWWLTFFMATVRSWFVESKEFDMLIKGGNLGLRIVERSNKKQGTIFILRDELAWLVDAVEEVVDVDSSEVFWDQSRAGCPRIFVQRRSNRHGRFITIEEFEGRNRRGSILIPEGRMVKVGPDSYRNLEPQECLCGRTVCSERGRWRKWTQGSEALWRL